MGLGGSWSTQGTTGNVNGTEEHKHMDAANKGFGTDAGEGIVDRITICSSFEK